MNRRRKKRFPVFLWHRRLGLLAVVFMVILAISGILLNHTESMSLDQTMIETDWLLDWYGLNPRGEPISFEAGGHVITQWDRQLFLDQRALLTSGQALRGARAVGEMIAVALEHDLVLLDNRGNIIENVDTRSQFDAINRLGRRQQRLLVQTRDDRYFESDEQVIGWTAAAAENIAEDIRWSQTTNIDPPLKQALLNGYRGQGLSLERVILDLHSGRIFNARWGVYIMDASAVMMLWLGFSGIWVWRSRQRKMKARKHYRRHH